LNYDTNGVLTTRNVGKPSGSSGAVPRMDGSGRMALVKGENYWQPDGRGWRPIR
jgi:hypothetical protein